MPGFALIWLAQIARHMCWQLKEREALQPQVQFSSFEEGGVEVANGVEAPDVSAAASERKTLVREAVVTGYPIAQEVVTADPAPVDVLLESGEIERVAANAVLGPFAIGGASAGCLARFLPAGEPDIVRRANGAVLGCAMSAG